jgi:[ribosomal protein S18]-alanine N-acetyltransferase
MESCGIIAPDVCGLRLMREEEAQTFAWWEKSERPYPWTPAHFTDTLNSPFQRTVVLEEGGELLGFAAVQVIGKEAYLLNIMVNPLKRGIGIGKRLLTLVSAWVGRCGANFLFLDVDPANKAALRLYQSLDFVHTGKRIGAYPRGEDSILMRKEL